MSEAAFPLLVCAWSPVCEQIYLYVTTNIFNLDYMYIPLKYIIFIVRYPL